MLWVDLIIYQSPHHGIALRNCRGAGKRSAPQQTASALPSACLGSSRSHSASAPVISRQSLAFFCLSNGRRFYALPYVLEVRFNFFAEVEKSARPLPSEGLSFQPGRLSRACAVDAGVVGALTRPEKSERSGVDDTDRLSLYGFVVVPIACRVCSRRGAYRLARLAAKFGPEMSMRDVLERFTYDCLWRAEARSKRGQPQAGLAKLSAAIAQGGFTHGGFTKVRKATKTPFNMVLEAPA
jgi:hypothetical protein